MAGNGLFLYPELEFVKDSTVVRLGTGSKINFGEE